MYALHAAQYGLKFADAFAHSSVRSDFRDLCFKLATDLP
jgi:hypothetical protein